MLVFYNLTETKQLPVIDEGFLSESFFFFKKHAYFIVRPDVRLCYLVPNPLVMFNSQLDFLLRRGRNRIGGREKWPKTSREEDEIREIKVDWRERWKCLQ